MKKLLCILSLCGIFSVTPQASYAEWLSNHHRLGVGIHYWTNIEDIIIDDADDNGLAFMLSYQYQMQKLFTLEGDLEIMGEGYAGASSSVIVPQIYALIGRGLYAGVGVGISRLEGEWADQPFWAIRGGLDVELLPSIFLDANVNYRSEKWDFSELDDDIRLKTLTLGAFLRFEF